MKRWTFAHTEDMWEDYLARLPPTTDPYREALLSREGKEKILNEALNAALENLMSWERVARAWGFEVEVLTDTGLGKPVPVLEGCTLKFVQSYGVKVTKANEGDAK